MGQGLTFQMLLNGWGKKKRKLVLAAIEIMWTVAAGAKAGITELWVGSDAIVRVGAVVSWLWGFSSDWRPGAVRKLHWWRFKNKFKCPSQLKDLAFDINNRRNITVFKYYCFKKLKRYDLLSHQHLFTSAFPRLVPLKIFSCFCMFLINK